MVKSNLISNLKKLAKEFDLKFNEKWFSSIWISKRENILKEYVGTCPDPVYNKYGKTHLKRIKNIEKFVKSKDFEKCLNRYGGQIATKSGLKTNNERYKLIKDEKLKQELLNLNKKIRKELGTTDYVALVTKTNVRKEREWLINNCIRHEWIHILLEKNKIHFQNKAKKYWSYDEGLVTYCEFFIDCKLGELELMKKSEKYPMQKKYFTYAIKFRELLKNTKTPKGRKKEIINLRRRLDDK